MRKMTSQLAALGIAAVGLTACATLGRQVFEPPEVRFKDLSVRGLGLDGGSLDVVLSVYNPNGYRLDATRLTYRLMVDSVPLGQGALDSRFVVQERESTTVRLPINFTYSGLGAAGRQLLRSGAVNYRVLGDVTVNTPLGNFTRPYDRTGQFTTFSGSRPSP
jgi:LEA14-like dessication related protein